MHRIIMLILACLSLLGGSETPNSWATATADTIMRRKPDFTKAYWQPWSYMHGYVLRGFEILWQRTGDQRYFDFIKRYLEDMVDAQGNIPSFKPNALDNFMAGNVLVGMWEHTHDPRYRIAAERMRKEFDTYPRTAEGLLWHATQWAQHEVWIDGVFMGQMFLSRYGAAVGDAAYAFDESTKQITLFAQRCQKGDSGLYLHAWSDKPAKKKWADPTTGLSREVWSEGLGWYATLLPEVLSVLPANHPQRSAVVDIFVRLAAGLKRTQDTTSGRWFQVVDRGDRSDNWTDNSGSAMFVYALQRGLEMKLLDHATYAEVVAAGYRGIVANATLTPDGLVNVASACNGVCVQDNYEKYVRYPRTVNAKEAVGAFLWATTVVEKPLR